MKKEALLMACWKNSSKLSIRFIVFAFLGVFAIVISFGYCMVSMSKNGVCEPFSSSMMKIMLDLNLLRFP